MALTGLLTRASDTQVRTHNVALRDRRVWRDAALIWLATRLLFAALTYLGETFLFIPAHSGQHVGWDALFRPWLGWDGANYAVIAREGYIHLWETQYFPLFPALEHVLAITLLQNPAATAVAGAIIANVAGFFALVLVRLLAERELGRAAAQRTLLYLAVFPTAFFFAASYTESLFLLLSVGTFLCLRRGGGGMAPRRSAGRAGNADPSGRHPVADPAHHRVPHLRAAVARLR